MGYLWQTFRPHYFQRTRCQHRAWHTVMHCRGASPVIRTPWQLPERLLVRNSGLQPAATREFRMSPPALWWLQPTLWPDHDILRDPQPHNQLQLKPSQDADFRTMMILGTPQKPSWRPNPTCNGKEPLFPSSELGLSVCPTQR